MRHTINVCATPGCAALYSVPSTARLFRRLTRKRVMARHMTLGLMREDDELAEGFFVGFALRCARHFRPRAR